MVSLRRAADGDTFDDGVVFGSILATPGVFNRYVRDAGHSDALHAWLMSMAGSTSMPTVTGMIQGNRFCPPLSSLTAI